MGFVSDYFDFKVSVTGSIIKALYVIGFIVILIVSIFIGFRTEGILGFVTGLLIFLIGNIIWRLFCEAIILMFSIHESLVNIEKNLKKD